MASAPPGLTQSKAEALARLLWGENRENMTPEEAAAMGDTILNRTELVGFPDTPEEVLGQNRGGRFQYSPMNPRNPNYDDVMGFGPGNPQWETYMGYANHILDPQRPRSAFTHYWTGPDPVWAGGLTDITRIGSHKFGRENRRRKK